MKTDKEIKDTVVILSAEGTPSEVGQWMLENHWKNKGYAQGEFYRGQEGEPSKAFVFIDKAKYHDDEGQAGQT